MQSDTVSDGSPYCSSTIAGGNDKRTPHETELEGARFQGQHVASIAAKLAAGQ